VNRGSERPTNAGYDEFARTNHGSSKGGLSGEED
jgi:hypothetical protein